MLVAMAGLPGTGKSTLAARLAAKLNGVVLSKDLVRAALFPPPTTDYTTAQDDLVLSAIFRAAEYLFCSRPERVVILDGRTFLRAYQVRDLIVLAQRLNQPLRVVQCVCDDTIAEARLERDVAAATHLAENRTFSLYQEVQIRAEPIAVPHLTLDTGELTLETCIERCLAYIVSMPP